MAKCCGNCDSWDENWSSSQSLPSPGTCAQGVSIFREYPGRFFSCILWKARVIEVEAQVFGLEGHGGEKCEHKLYTKDQFIPDGEYKITFKPIHRVNT